MMESFNVSLLSKIDSKQIAQIEKTCFTHGWSQTAIEDSFSHGTAFFGIKQNDNLVAYCGLQIVCGEGYITNVAVLPEHRRKGLGKLLIQRLVSFAQEQKLVFLTLEVRTSNTPAIELYRKFGFENAGTRKNFYSLPTEDAYIMTRQM